MLLQPETTKNNDFYGINTMKQHFMSEMDKSEAGTPVKLSKQNKSAKKSPLAETHREKTKRMEGVLLNQ